VNGKIQVFPFVVLQDPEVPVVDVGVVGVVGVGVGVGVRGVGVGVGVAVGVGVGVGVWVEVEEAVEEEGVDVVEGIFTILRVFVSVT
jgi:hypothetical protein